MAPLEGETLGQRHVTLNRRTNETVQRKLPFVDIEKLPELNDTDRLYKIDVAAKYRNVPYILSNLKSDDDLYVARALKKSPWLFSQPEYADIINPEYLETQLYPLMTSRAVAKTRLNVRLHLKDESRAEQFYKHMEIKDRKNDALKWLPKCSVAFIEDKLQVEWRAIDPDMFKKLCEKTFKAFEIITKKRKNDYGLKAYLEAAMFLLNTNPEQFLDSFEEIQYNRPNFKKHATKIILTKCPDRLRSKLEEYIRNIDLTVLGRYLGPEETKAIIVKMVNMKSLRGWFNYRNLRPLIETLPKKGQFEFVKGVFVDKTMVEELEEEEYMIRAMSVQCKRRCVKKKSVSVSSVYQWYRMAPFSLAFMELKKLIRTESSAEERVAMLKVLVGSAGKNKDNIYSLLQYYRERHINEPAKFKASFVSSLLDATDSHEYEERSWKLLDVILHSLEIYSEDGSFSELDCAIRAIVTYNLVHDKPIPEVILKKFMNNFSTLKEVRKSLDKDKKNTVYNFLRSQLQHKFEAKYLKDNDCDMHDLNYVLELMKDWQKNITQDADVMKLIPELIKLRAPTDNLANIYNTEKKWRRALFEYSLDLVRTEDVYINAMKHNPAMILERRYTLDYVIKSDVVDLGRVLRKLRVYFPETISTELLKIYEEKLQACRKEPVGYKAVTQGICILMERNKFINLLQGFVPENYKIEWSVEDAAVVNIRKYLSLQMYTVRPALKVETVLLFAKGDYLQFALPSLVSVCYRKSRDECRRFLPTLIGGPVSLQKHGIRLACAKLESEELVNTFTQVWNVTKNASIRAIIFNSTFDLLCHEKNSPKIVILWELLKTLMKHLTPEEDRSVYAKISKVGKIPEIIRGELCVMSYELLKSLPPKLNCEDLAKGMIREMTNIIDTIDEDVLTEILSKYIQDMYEKKGILKGRENSQGNHRDIMDLIGKYIICCREEETQARRYEKVLKKITEHSLLMWNAVGKDNIKPKHIFEEIVEKLMDTTKYEVIEHEPKYVNPVRVFRQILNGIDQLSVEENYKILTTVKLAVEYCDSYATIQQCLPAQMDIDEELENGEAKRGCLVSKMLGPEFGKRCLAMLKIDLQKHFPSIAAVFTEVLRKFLNNNYSTVDIFTAGMLGVFTEDGNDISANILAMNLYPHYIKHCEDDLKQEFMKIRQRFVDSDKLEIKLHYHAISLDED